MAQTIETLSVKLEGDAKGFSDSLDQAKQKTSAFSSLAQGALMGVGLGVINMAAQAGQALTGFASDGIGMASDLGETMSKVGVVFGENAAAVTAWSANAATALGQSQAEAAGAAATFGNLFVSMGMASGPSADMSMNLVNLASDLASFNNIDPGVALEKLRAGMLGQSEPMQALGVNMTAAATSAKALEMGLAASTDELTPAMLAQARYAIILDQTKTAQGDFARTSEGLANQQRIADAQWKELQTTLGSLLLPVVTAVTSALNKLLKDVLPPLTAFVNTQLMPVFEAVAKFMSDSLGPALAAAQGFFAGFGKEVQAQTDGPLNFFRGWMEQNMPRIQQIVQTVLGAINTFWQQHGEQIMRVVNGFLEIIKNLWETQFRTILNIVQIALQLLTGDFEGAGQTLRSILSDWRLFFESTIRTIVNGIREWFTSVDWGGIGRGILEGIAAGIRNSAGLLRDAAWNAAAAIPNWMRDVLGIGSPSKVAAEEIGVPFAQGIAVGINDALRSVSASVASGLDGMLGNVTLGMQGSGADAFGGATITQNFYGAAEPGAVRTASLGGVNAGLRAAGRK